MPAMTTLVLFSQFAAAGSVLFSDSVRSKHGYQSVFYADSRQNARECSGPEFNVSPWRLVTSSWRSTAWRPLRLPLRHGHHSGVISLLAILLAPILLIRFRKRWVASFNLAVTNRITSRFADRLPGFGIPTHVGRKSGRLYHAPVNVFREPEGFLIALTHGRDSEWVKNVLAAGGCELETRGVWYLPSAPTIVHDPTRRRFPRFRAHDARNHRE